MIAIDFHTHTYHSYDSLMRPEKILKIASEKGLNAIVINDHNTIKGGLECKKINTNKNLEVIIGAEVYTSIGDVTGIFLKEEIQSKNFSDVVQEIKNQGGITVLNHPYHGHKLSDINFDGIDLIEGYNGRLSIDKNELAVKLALEHKKPIIAGSDAHTYNEIANCKTYYEKDLLNLLNPLRTEYKRCDALALIKSQSIKAYKQKDLHLLLRVMISAPKKIAERFISD